MKYSTIALAALALTTAACDDLQVEGSLGRGEFDYLCGNPGDATCDGASAIVGITFDREVNPVVVEGTFGLAFEGDEESYDILPAAPNLVRQTAGFFAFVEPGITDFLAVDEDGKVADFAPMTAANMDALAIFYGGQQQQSVALRRFQEELIAAAPLSQGTVLGGGLDFNWQVQGTGVDVRAGSGNVIAVEVRDSSAMAIVTATARGFQASITITAQ